mgnify:CR=1 FL=1
MKKILLLISCLIISVASTFAAGLNAYAFGAGYIYDANTNKLHISWSQQAQAARVTIVALDGDNRYVLAEYNNLGAARHEYIIDLWDAVAAGMPTNTDLEVAIEVRTADRTKHEFVKKIDFQWPFSIDIDRNPYSKYFGLMYVGQMNNNNNNKDRGIYVLDQQGDLAKGAQIDKDITLYDYWFDRTHAVPFMVRTFQDGTGRLLISSSDRSQDTHLWLAKPQTGDAVPVYSEWTNVITSTQLKDWTGHGKVSSSDKFANAGLDIRDNGDYWDILLYMATVNSSTANHDAGNAYSGMYRVAKSSTNLTDGTYTSYTAPTPNPSYDSGFKTHSVISNAYTASMLNASANFDKFGGVLYNATSEDDNPNNSAFIHKTLNGQFKSDYADGDYLKRSKARTKGARFSPDFSKLAIAQGRMADELRIYNVSQNDGNSHPVLSNGQSVNIVTSTSGATYAYRVFAHDIAWDYAQNVYVAVRNEGARYGIYAVATDLNGEPVTTPVQGTFNVNCPDGEFTISLSSNIDAGATLTGAGTYASCTPVTVTATPDGSHKFLRWSEGGVEVSKEPSYTFYATKNRNLVAEFEYAVYNNITWWNLFENGEDIVDPDTDTERNARLWRLFQVEYNAYANTSPSQSDKGEAKGTSGSTRLMYKVLQFVNTNFGKYDDDSKNEVRALIEDFLDNDSDPSNLYWLGQYIESVVGKDINEQSYVNVWGFYLQSFINRTVKSHNQDFTSATNVGTTLVGNYKIIDFSEKSKPEHWRPYWTEKVCNLPSTMTYNDAMPTDWNTSDCSTGSIAGITPSSWYKWNKVTSPQNNGNSDTHIRAWRKDGVKGPIIARVEEDNLRLYATYVKKHIHEDDPEPDMSGDYPQDATNSDVFRLLFNKTWGPNYAHKLTITRKIQGGMYNTICFPFKVYLGDNGSMPDDNPFKQAMYWEYIGTSSKYNESGEPVTILDFQQETEVLEAGVPYLVWSDNDITQEEILFGVPGWDDPGRTQVFCDTVPKTVPAREGSPVPITFVGTINPTEVPAESIILVANNRLAQTTTKGRMKGMRGYFTIDPMWAAEIAEQAADGRVYLSMKKPATTSIPVAPEAEQQTKPEVRKIMRDGQIYILRGDEIYTITGNRVK